VQTDDDQQHQHDDDDDDVIVTSRSNNCSCTRCFIVKPITQANTGSTGALCLSSLLHITVLLHEFSCSLTIACNAKYRRTKSAINFSEGKKCISTQIDTDSLTWVREARRAKNRGRRPTVGGGVLGEEAASPLPSAIGSL